MKTINLIIVLTITLTVGLPCAFTAGQWRGENQILLRNAGHD